MTRRVSPCLILKGLQEPAVSPEFYYGSGTSRRGFCMLYRGRMSRKKPRLHARAWPRLEAALISSLLSFLPFSLPFFPSLLSSCPPSSPPFLVSCSHLSWRGCLCPARTLRLISPMLWQALI